MTLPETGVLQKSSIMSNFLKDFTKKAQNLEKPSFPSSVSRLVCAGKKTCGPKMGYTISVQEEEPAKSITGMTVASPLLQMLDRANWPISERTGLPIPPAIYRDDDDRETTTYRCYDGSGKLTAVYRHNGPLARSPTS